MSYNKPSIPATKFKVGNVRNGWVVKTQKKGSGHTKVWKKMGNGASGSTTKPKKHTLSPQPSHNSPSPKQNTPPAKSPATAYKSVLQNLQAKMKRKTRVNNLATAVNEYRSKSLINKNSKPKCPISLTNYNEENLNSNVYTLHGLNGKRADGSEPYNVESLNQYLNSIGARGQRVFQSPMRTRVTKKKQTLREHLLEPIMEGNERLQTNFQKQIITGKKPLSLYKAKVDPNFRYNTEQKRILTRAQKVIARKFKGGKRTSSMWGTNVNPYNVVKSQVWLTDVEAKALLITLMAATPVGQTSKTYYLAYPELTIPTSQMSEILKNKLKDVIWVKNPLYAIDNIFPGSYPTKRNHVPIRSIQFVNRRIDTRYYYPFFGQGPPPTSILQANLIIGTGDKKATKKLFFKNSAHGMINRVKTTAE